MSVINKNCVYLSVFSGAFCQLSAVNVNNYEDQKTSDSANSWFLYVERERMSYWTELSLDRVR